MTNRKSKIKNQKCTVLLASCFLLLASAAHADWTLTTADFTSDPNLTVNSWDIDQGLSLTSQSGKLRTVQTRDVVSLVSSKPRTPAAPASWRLILRNGDLLDGDPVSISGQSLLFRTRDAG